jgi:hypothetical protein
MKFNDIYIEYITQHNFRDAARLLSISGKYSMKWTNAMPMKNYGIKLTNNEFKISDKLALGCQQYPMFF